MSTPTTVPGSVASFDWPDTIAGLLRREHLSSTVAAAALGEMVGDRATPAQAAGFLIALRAKGETPGEVAALLGALLSHAVPLPLNEPPAAGSLAVRLAAGSGSAGSGSTGSGSPLSSRLLDTCGTGGDRHGTVNVSTAAAIVCAASGVRVLKHGNRAASSQAGSADVLEALGVAVDLGASAVAACLSELGIGFAMAPLFHPSLRHLGPVRRQLGVPTVVNVLGPLANPGHPTAQVVGVADRLLAPVVAAVLAERGSSALVVRGEDGLDEWATTTTTHVWVVGDGRVGLVKIEPEQVLLNGVPLRRATLADLRGGDPEHNAARLRALFAGEQGAVREVVLLNAAAGMLAATGVGDLVGLDGSVDAAGLLARLAEHATAAATAVDSGAAQALLERWVSFSQELRAG